MLQIFRISGRKTRETVIISRYFTRFIKLVRFVKHSLDYES